MIPFLLKCFIAFYIDKSGVVGYFMELNMMNYMSYEILFLLASLIMIAMRNVSLNSIMSPVYEKGNLCKGIDCHVM
jgi:hypothetical protein